MFDDLLKSSSSLGTCYCVSVEWTITNFLIMLLSPSSPSCWTKYAPIGRCKYFDFFADWWSSSV